MTTIDSLDDTNALKRLQQELSQRDPAIKISAIRYAVAFKERAPRHQLLLALTDQCAEVRTTAAATIEALKPWITDEQWLETLQETTRNISFAAAKVLIALGKKAPIRPLISPAVIDDRSLRFFTQDTLRLKIAQWPPETQAQFIQYAQTRLQQGSARHRAITLEMLGLLDEHVPLEVFFSALYDSEITVRLAALEQLRKRGEQGHCIPIATLINLLTDPNARVRYRSLSVVDTQKEGQPIDLLIAMLHDPDESVRYRVASMLSRRRVVQAIPELLELLLTDLSTDDTNRYGDEIEDIFQALQDLHTSIPLEPLLKALENTTKTVHLMAITILSLLQERTPVTLLLSFLDHKDPALRIRAIWALHDHLMHIPKEAIVNMLRDRQKTVRRAASRMLLNTKVEIPTQLLLPFLTYLENIARATAFELIGHLIPIAQLIAATHDPHWTVRIAALKVAGTLKGNIPLAVFLEALCDHNLSVRQTALIALSTQSDQTLIPLLIDALHDRRRVSGTAEEILEKLGKRVPQHLIVQALDDPMAMVRSRAIHLLQAIAYEEPFPVAKVKKLLYDQDAYVREAAIQALTQVGALDPVEPFIAALKDDHHNVREAALLALTSLGKHAPREPLKALLGESEMFDMTIASLQKTHPDVLHEVAAEASNILLGAGAGQVLGSLIQAHVAEAIGNMHNPGPLLVNRLLTLLDWSYGSVSQKAQQALCKLDSKPDR